MVIFFKVFLVLMLSPSGAQTSKAAHVPFTEANETCVLGETCTLQCPAQGQVKEFHWKNGKNLLPIDYYPASLKLYKDSAYINMTSVSLEQPGGGAVLRLRGVQMKHEGRYHCKVIFTSGNVSDHFVNLRVDTPDKSHLHYLWLLLLVPVAVTLGVVYIYYEMIRQMIQTALTKCTYLQ